MLRRRPTSVESEGSWVVLLRASPVASFLRVEPVTSIGSVRSVPSLGLPRYNKRIVIPTKFRREKAWTPMKNVAPRDASDIEAIEQREWLESLDYVVQQGDRGRVQRLLASLRHRARSAGVSLPFTAETAYVNTLRPADETPLPGSQEIRAAHQEPRAVERDGHGRARQPGVGGHRWTHLDLCLRGNPVRGGVQPLLQSPDTGRRR